MHINLKESLLSIVVNHKIMFARIVTQCSWIEVAFWRTSMSTLKGWGYRWQNTGFRIVTPLVGAAVCMHRGK